VGLTISFTDCGAQEGLNDTLTESQAVQNADLTDSGGSTKNSTTFQQVLKESTATSTSPTAYYGDTMNNEVVVIDIESMKLLKRIPTDGINTYTIDKLNSDYKKVYAITRSSKLDGSDRCGDIRDRENDYIRTLSSLLCF